MSTDLSLPLSAEFLAEAERRVCMHVRGLLAERSQLIAERDELAQRVAALEGRPVIVQYGIRTQGSVLALDDSLSDCRRCATRYARVWPDAEIVGRAALAGDWVPVDRGDA
ncbi:hypothetical protein [Streptomyces syringium]|uniref:hypothetical protein n=1 Tax=Streptomyces syringium TaxID=76729 RepID=UPI00345299E6